MSQFTPGLQLPFLTPGLGSHVPANFAFIRLDAIVGRAALAFQNDAPATPADLSLYLIKTPTTGDPWEGHGGEVAIFVGGRWEYIEPVRGLRIWVETDHLEYYFNGASWEPLFASFAARKSSGAQTTTSATFDGLDMQTGIIEPADVYSHPHGGDDAQVQVKYAGRYLVELTCQVEASGGAAEAEFALGVNSQSAATTGTERQVSLGSGAFAAVQISQIVSLVAGDWVAGLFRRISGSGTVSVASNRMGLRILRLAT